MLDDRVFGEEFIRGRLKRRPAGTMKLRAELRKKGMPDTVIEELLESYDGMQGALAAAEKKWLPFSALPLLCGKRNLRYSCITEDSAGRKFGMQKKNAWGIHG